MSLPPDDLNFISLSLLGRKGGAVEAVDTLFVSDGRIDPVTEPFVEYHVSDAAVIERQLKKAQQTWVLEDWSGREVAEYSGRFMQFLGEGNSPREAFRSCCYLRQSKQPHRYRAAGKQLAKRLNLSLPTHLLVTRLAEEYGDTYTGLIRDIVETWAEQHRMILWERPELDIRYDPSREDSGGTEP